MGMVDEIHMTRIIDKLTDIGERLVVVETLLQELTERKKDIYITLKEHDERLTELEQHKARVVTFKDGITWLFMAIIAILGVINR